SNPLTLERDAFPCPLLCTVRPDRSPPSSGSGLCFLYDWLPPKWLTTPPSGPRRSHLRVEEKPPLTPLKSPGTPRIEWEADVRGRHLGNGGGRRPAGACRRGLAFEVAP